MDVPEIGEHRLIVQGLMSGVTASPLNHTLTPSYTTGDYSFSLPQHQNLITEGDAPLIEQTSSAGLLEIPAPRRKPKARTLRERDWEPVKSRVLELMKTNTLTEVRAILVREVGFDAT